MGTILVDPHPRQRAVLFADADWARIERLGHRIVIHDAPSRMPDAEVDACLPDAVAVIGQTSLGAERLARAPHLRAVVNVESNFLPNIDYDACFARGIHVLSTAPAFGPAVAELALALALDLIRGVTLADRSMRAGSERFGFAGNQDSFLLSGAPIGLIGFGNLGRALRPLLAPFGGTVRVHDPWLPDGLLRAHACEPAGLDEVLSRSRVIFVLAGATADNAAMIGERELALIQPGSAFVLISRAAVVDFPALLRHAQAGRFRIATDVFPEEPVAADDPVRGIEGLLLSPHRAGSLAQSYFRMGEMVTDDLQLVLAGLPPARLQRAERETVRHLRSKPIG